MGQSVKAIKPSSSTANYREQLARAQQLLQQGRAADCLAACRQLLQLMPGEVNALHLSALGLHQTGRVAEADAAFKAALGAAPGSVEVLLAYGNFLRREGRPSQAEVHLRKATRLAPKSAPAWHALALLLFHSLALEEAAQAAQTFIALAPDKPASWELLAAVAQKDGRIGDALDACRRGLERIPGAPRLHYSLAQLLRQDCEFAAAADSYAEALRWGFASPDLYRNRAEALLESGDAAAAQRCAADGAVRFPGNASLQRTAAHMHFSTQAPGDPVALLHSCARAESRNADLWQALVELLKRLNREAEASAVLVEARRAGCPDSSGILTLEAMDAAYRGDSPEAIRRFNALLPRYPNNLSVLHSFAMQLLASGDPLRAEAICAQVLERDPYDQMALAYRGTALQLLGDAREHWLLDYEKMVVPVEVPVPEGFASREAFFSALRAVLEDLHHTKAQPIEQSVRGGTQTNGFLFRLKDPLLATLEAQIRKAIVTALAQFPVDAGHPFWSRRVQGTNGDGLRFAGAWSVRLRDQGFHSNHIHPRGWVSSALYISLPDEVARGTDTQGHIQFGTPMHELGVTLAPRRTVKPSVGTLVLFPSYMWHGTLPFHSDQPRITVAFDLLPQT